MGLGRLGSVPSLNLILLDLELADDPSTKLAERVSGAEFRDPMCVMAATNASGRKRDHEDENL
jgi:uncharacterized lipoprotein YbaY